MPVPPALASLPIAAVLPDLLDRLEVSPNAVLQAPPGAGKTTGVPLALLGASWLGTARIVMLEPRRLAARAAARRMAALLGQDVGQTVGYRMRFETRIGPATRIEVVTEGVFTRLIQDDPSLEGIGAVLFDEFHERSLASDLGLALALEAQAGLRADLRLLVMSATLDGEAVASLMGGAPVVTSQGKAYPVETRWLPAPWTGRLEDGMARLIGQAMTEEPEGDILAFLPGGAEIRRLERILSDQRTDTEILPLYGDLPQAEQDRALAISPGRRKVILASAIAETSLTIEGVRIIVDGGRARLPRFDPATGMSRLVTVPVSKASAEQRKGRAGRQGPGICYRLWTEADHRALPAFAPPEIRDADLAPLALELARWGAADPASLSWLDPPPAANYAQARTLLTELGALDLAGRITRHGKTLARLPVHPRLAHMLVKGKELGLGELAATVAALLSERDRPGHDSDLRRRVEALRDPRPGPTRRIGQAAKQLERLISLKNHALPDASQTGLVLAFAYPDRIGRRRAPQSLKYRLASGQGAFFTEPEPLCLEEYLAVAALDGERREARIFLAAPLTRTEIEDHFAEFITCEETIAWDARAEQVSATRSRRLGQLVLEETPLASTDPARVEAALLDGVRQMGLDCLPWTRETDTWLARVAFLRRLEGELWPDLSRAALADSLEDWLAPWLAGLNRKAHLARLDLAQALSALLDYKQRKALDAQAPTHIQVPSGSRIAIDYTLDPPVLAVRLQEMFGLTETPAIAGGRVPLMLHLLSPARRPVQVTRDLASFWAKAYAEVKADLKGQYPKHHWPDDPLAAEPTARAKRRGE